MSAAALVAALVFAPALHAQTATPEQVIDHVLANAKTYDHLSYLTDEIGPRLSGSANAALAVDWATKQFRSWGIDVHQEKVMVPHWVRGAERGQLVSHHDQKLVLTALGGSVATPAAGLTADVIEVGSYEELEKLGRENVRGKIVFYNKAMDKTLVESGRAFEAYGQAVTFRGTGASRAAEFGAVAAVIRSVATSSLRSPHTGSLHYLDEQPKVPAAALSTEDAELVHRLLARGDRVRMHLVLTPRMLPDAESANVVSEIRGTEHPEEIVLIGGHLDSWDLGTGAIDNASGAAMVMETMRALKELGVKPKRTIRGVLFMNEENGLRGGRKYFENASKREELNRHVAAIEVDAGVAPPTGFITTLEGKPLEALQRRATALNRIAPMTFTSSKHTGADTSPLTDAGVTGYGFVPDPRHYFDFHHSPADTLDKVDPKALTQDTATVAGLAYILAND